MGAPATPHPGGEAKRVLLCLIVLARPWESLCLPHPSLPQFPQLVNEVRPLGAMPGGAGIRGDGVTAIIGPESDGMKLRFQAAAAPPKWANPGFTVLAPALWPCRVPPCGFVLVHSVM